MALAGIIVLLIANTELVWATSYVETLATIDSIERTCAEGRSGRIRYVACGEALPGADRRTLLELSYISPADGRRHQATIRCDTSAEQTPLFRAGEQLPVLAHKSEGERVDRRRCTTLDPSEAKS